MQTVFSGSYDKKLSGKTLGLQPFVLSDMSMVVTKKSVNRHFGHSAKSDWLNEFMSGFTRYGIGATGLLEKLSNPVLFASNKKDGFPIIEEGYTLQTILEACDFLIFAKKEGFLNVIELKFASIAESIISSHKSSPLAHQVAELTGLNLIKWKSAQRVLEILSEKQKENAHNWVHGLTDEFWNLLSEQLQTDWKQIIKNPVPAAKFIHEWIFSRIDETTMEEMRNAKPKRSYRTKKGPQVIGNDGLSFYQHILLGLYGVSDKNLQILEQLISRTHPKKRSANFPSEPQKPTLPAFAKQLHEAVVVKK
ncbi:hypothetical protein [Flavobacterium sp.]|uniref:hypothetical protein n=1 Tax=Flavobacterium sp. TaxID=239 RepID=UPI00120003B9|nr:hypothetical protein [Flavobacterium sp.]RZJ72489.1 MAG: hypothetical protein EOO49_06130 [Flavobacterium sp.]